ncbi:MAG: glycosyltransferase family 2 protein [Phycisphaerae bacterium]
MLLSILVPVYNESATIVQILDRVFSISWPTQIEVVVVNDASSDRTQEVLESVRSRWSNVQIYHHGVNQGKGAAIRTALGHAKGDIVTIQDADLEYDPADLVKLLEPILTGRADVVYGSRFLAGASSPKLHQWVNKFLTNLSNFFTGLHLTDMETCYKVMRGEFAKKLKLRSQRFGMEPEITAKLAQSQARFVELPISYRFRNYAEGKKINWWDGIKAMVAIVYFRFGD